MKKFLAVTASILFALNLCACSDKDYEEDDNDDASIKAEDYVGKNNASVSKLDTSENTTEDSSTNNTLFQGADSLEELIDTLNNSALYSINTISMMPPWYAACHLVGTADYLADIDEIEVEGYDYSRDETGIENAMNDLSTMSAKEAYYKIFMVYSKYDEDFENAVVDITDYVELDSDDALDITYGFFRSSLGMIEDADAFYWAKGTYDYFHDTGSVDDDIEHWDCDLSELGLIFIEVDGKYFWVYTGWL